VPILPLQGGGDGAVLPGWTQRLTARLTAAGADAVVEVDPSADHGSIVDAGAEQVTGWLLARLGAG
jgi:dienelactone hydrolase